MSSCLLTTLKGSVDDDSLPYYGEINFDCALLSNEELGWAKDNPSILSVSFLKAFKVLAEGGDLSDPTSGTSYGHVASFPAGAANIKLSKTVTKIKLLGEYQCSAISRQGAYLVPVGILLDNNSIKYQKNITELNLTATGCVRYIDNDLPQLLKEHASLKKISARDLSCGINLADFSNLKALTYLSLLNMPNANGAIDSLSELSNLTTLAITEQPNANISGDISLMPNSITKIDFTKNPATYSWKNTRSANTAPFSLVSVRLGSDVDAALVNLAACTKESPLSTAEKIMTFIGTRTSASDAAVAALQAKGWTITVTEA